MCSNVPLPDLDPEPDLYKFVFEGKEYYYNHSEGWESFIKSEFNYNSDTEEYIFYICEDGCIHYSDGSSLYIDLDDENFLEVGESIPDGIELFKGEPLCSNNPSAVLD